MARHPSDLQPPVAEPARLPAAPASRRTPLLGELVPALRATLVTLVLTGLAYPIAMTGLAQALLPWRAGGSLVTDPAGNVLGAALLAPGVTRRLIEEFVGRPQPASPPPVLTGLTDRETEVLMLVGRGRSNAEIAADLHITVATVKTYVSRLLSKLNARDRVQLVIIAYDAGLVSAPRAI